MAGASSSQVLASWLHSGEPEVADRVALATRADDGWTELTYRRLAHRSSGVAAWLAAGGVQPGERVALLGEAGGDWASALLGILRRGAVAVTLDVKLTDSELGSLCPRSGLAAAIVSPTQDKRWRQASDGRMATLDMSVAAEGGGADVDREMDDPAVMVWTSGTTGPPKAVTLSFGNLVYVVTAASTVHRIGADARWLSILPPNHLLELCCGLLPALASSSTTFVARTIVPHELTAMMAECRVNQMVVVPMTLRMMQRSIEREMRRTHVARAWSRVATAVAAIPSTTLRRLVFAPVHHRLGGHLEVFYCGGAPIDADVVSFFDRIGIDVFGGYGLSEAAPTVATNSPGHNRPGSVGRPLPGTEVRLAADGEILVRGPGVMLGYWDDPAATRDAIDDDGWLRTGDLGHLDPDGYLFVTGRAKSLIVLDTGKKVQPEEVEATLALSDLFAEVCVLGWRAPAGMPRAVEQVCVVVVPKTPLSEDAAIEEVRRLTAGLSGFKRPTVVRVHAGELPKTAKRSVRRADVARLLDDRPPLLRP